MKFAKTTKFQGKSGGAYGPGVKAISGAQSGAKHGSAAAVSLLSCGVN
jgi:hypothetical protein